MIKRRRQSVHSANRRAPFRGPAEKKGIIEIDGVITEALPDAMFRVRLEDGRIVLSHLSGKMRMFHIKVMPGDRVKLQMTPYDQTRGRIVLRLG